MRDQLNSGIVPDGIDIHCLSGLIKVSLFLSCILRESVDCIIFIVAYIVLGHCMFFTWELIN